MHKVIIVLSILYINFLCSIELQKQINIILAILNYLQLNFSVNFHLLKFISNIDDIFEIHKLLTCITPLHSL